jgi:hypothetical protein
VAAPRALPRAIDIVALRATNAALFFPILSILSAAQWPFIGCAAAILSPLAVVNFFRIFVSQLHHNENNE